MAFGAVGCSDWLCLLCVHRAGFVPCTVERPGSNHLGLTDGWGQPPAWLPEIDYGNSCWCTKKHGFLFLHPAGDPAVNRSVAGM